MWDSFYPLNNLPKMVQGTSMSKKQWAQNDAPASDADSKRKPQRPGHGTKVQRTSNILVKSQWLWYILALLPHTLLLLCCFVIPYFLVLLAVVCVPALVKFVIENLRLAPTRRQPRGPAVVKKVAVVGAGASGLVTVKELIAKGHDVTCFEKLDNVGGVFYYQQERGGCWDTTRLTSSPFVTAFSDFPPADGDEIHWHRSEYMQYLHKYVAKFGLREYISFNTTIQSVKEIGDGTWQVTSCVDGKTTQTQLFDSVVICSGLNQEPNIPHFEGQEKFKANGGEIIHSCWYKNTERFKDKVILFVGIGETGADLIKVLSHSAKKVYVSIRRGTFVIPRLNGHTGLNNDYDTNRLRYAVPIAIRDALIRSRDALSYYMGYMGKEGLIRYRLGRMSGAGPMSQFACKSDEFVSALAAGRAQLKPSIRQMTMDGAIFSRYNFTRNRIVREESSVKVDLVLLCTGFKGKASFVQLKNGEDIGCMSKMYKKMFIPECGTGIVFVGFARPSIGAIPPISEMQARYLAQVLSGHSDLPSVDAMHERVRFDLKNHNFTRDGARPTLCNWIQYMDEVAQLIGCRPAFHQLVKQPRLLWSVIAGTYNSASYRLSGPDAKPEIATHTISSLPRGMPLLDLFVWTLWGTTAAVLREFGVPGFSQFSTVL